LAKLKELARVRMLVIGGPEEDKEAWVVEGSVEGFRRAVVGMWRVKRAAEMADASQARVANEVRILVKSWWGWEVGGVGDVAETLGAIVWFGGTSSRSWRRNFGSYAKTSRHLHNMILVLKFVAVKVALQ
jgi:hypothetical protein